MTSARIGILLCQRDSDRQIGLIEFRPEGVLEFHILRSGLHVFALKPVERVLREFYQEPLYRKYAALIKRKGRLSIAILKREAMSGAAVLNRAKPTLSIRNTHVRARVVQYQE